MYYFFARTIFSSVLFFHLFYFFVCTIFALYYFFGVLFFPYSNFAYSKILYSKFIDPKYSYRWPVLRKLKLGFAQLLIRQNRNEVHSFKARWRRFIIRSYSSCKTINTRIGAPFWPLGSVGSL